MAIVATLTLGLQLKQRGYKVAGQKQAWESRQRGCTLRKGAGQEEAQESYHTLPGV
jgi:hypothetical protein